MSNEPDPGALVVPDDVTALLVPGEGVAGMAARLAEMKQQLELTRDFFKSVMVEAVIEARG